MSCFKNDIIQKYIDGEASPMEAALLEKHMADCAQCSAKVAHQRHLSQGIKKAMNILVQNHQDVRAFAVPAGKAPMRSMVLKKVVYGLSAACILALIFVLVPNKEPLKECPGDNQITILYSLGQQVDANRPIMDQDIVITIVGPDGKVMAYPE